MVQLLQAAQRQWHGLIGVLPAVKETRQFLEDCAAAREPAAPSPQEEPLVPQREVALEGVCLVHENRGKPALDCVSLVLPVGSLTAIVGPSGGGKSTLADVLIGLSVPDAGNLRVDGKVMAGADLRRWRRAVACVQQDTFLFNASVRDNLLWGHPAATDEDLGGVLELAAAGFVFALPHGLDTLVGDDGVRLSGGERQRIALARELLRKPALLVLDEATSALDPESEALINAAIAGLAGTMTIVAIGHRLGIVDFADQVIRLDQGRRQ
jgi:ATP-binding cassette subfamily C protein